MAQFRARAPGSGPGSGVEGPPGRGPGCGDFFIFAQQFEKRAQGEKRDIIVGARWLSAGEHDTQQLLTASRKPLATRAEVQPRTRRSIRARPGAAIRARGGVRACTCAHLRRDFRRQLHRLDACGGARRVGNVGTAAGINLNTARKQRSRRPRRGDETTSGLGDHEAADLGAFTPSPY